MKYIIILLLLTINVQAIEGTGTRGGGSGVAYVVDGEIKEVIFTDIYRSLKKEKSDQSYIIDPYFKQNEVDGISDPELLSEIFLLKVYERLAKHASTENLAENMLKVSKQLKEWTDIPESHSIPLTNDWGQPLELQDNEVMVQVIERDLSQLQRDLNLYNKMSALSRMAAKLHEPLYALHGGENSFDVQNLISVMISANFDSLSSNEIKSEILNSSGFKYHSLPEDPSLINLPENAKLFEIQNEDMPRNRIVQKTTDISKIFSWNHNDDEKHSITVSQSGKYRRLITSFNKDSNEYYKRELKISKNDYDDLLDIRNEVKSYFKAQYPKFLYPGTVEMEPLILFNNNDDIKYMVFTLAIDSHKNDEAECNANYRAKELVAQRKQELFNNIKTIRSRLDSKNDESILSIRESYNKKLDSVISKLALAHHKASCSHISPPEDYRYRDLLRITIEFVKPIEESNNFWDIFKYN